MVSRRAVAIVLTGFVASGCWLTKSFDALDCTNCGADSGLVDAPSTSLDGGGGTLEASSDAPTTSDPCADAYFCANFEKGLGAFTAADEQLSNGSTIAPDTTEHEHGSSSVKVTAGESAAVNAFLVRTTTLGEDSYMRMFVFVPSGPAKSTSDADYIAMAQLTQGDDTVSVRIDGPADARVFELGDARNNIYQFSQTAFPFDRWACVEWHIGSSGMQLWLDDVELKDVATAGALPVPSKEFFGVATPAGLSSSLTLWMDEIIVAKSKVGCTAFQQE